MYCMSPVTFHGLDLLLLVLLGKEYFFERGKKMLWTICVILFVLWALGMVTSFTMGGAIHVLLVLALVVLVFQLIQGRRSIV
jgi:hypothetical protein